MLLFKLEPNFGSKKFAMGLPGKRLQAEVAIVQIQKDLVYWKSIQEDTRATNGSISKGALKDENQINDTGWH